MKRIIVLCLLTILLTPLPDAYSANPLEGIREADLVVHPPGYTLDVAAVVGKYIQLRRGATTVVAVSVNTYKGGVLNFKVIEFGTVEVAVMRRAYVLLDDKASPRNSRTLLTNAVVWHGSRVMYNDTGTGLGGNILDSVARLIQDARIPSGR